MLALRPVPCLRPPVTDSECAAVSSRMTVPGTCGIFLSSRIPRKGILAVVVAGDAKVSDFRWSQNSKEEPICYILRCDQLVLDTRRRVLPSRRVSGFRWEGNSKGRNSALSITCTSPREQQLPRRPGHSKGWFPHDHSNGEGGTSPTACSNLGKMLGLELCPISVWSR